MNGSTVKNIFSEFWGYFQVLNNINKEKTKITHEHEHNKKINKELTSKNNRPVKIVKITELGKKIYTETFSKLEPHHKVVKERIANTDLEKVGELLRELREILEDTIDIDI